MSAPGKPDVAELVRRADCAIDDDADRLDQLLTYCWPGGDDRYVPAGLAWVRNWGPAPVTARLPVCRCASGRCGVCN